MMNQTDLDRVRKQRVTALERYKKNYREMSKLRQRLSIVETRVRRYSAQVDECEQILEANGLKF